MRSILTTTALHTLGHDADIAVYATRATWRCTSCWPQLSEWSQSGARLGQMNKFVASLLAAALSCSLTACASGQPAAVSRAHRPPSASRSAAAVSIPALTSRQRDNIGHELGQLAHLPNGWTHTTTCPVWPTFARDACFAGQVRLSSASPEAAVAALEGLPIVIDTANISCTDFGPSTHGRTVGCTGIGFTLDHRAGVSIDLASPAFAARDGRRIVAVPMNVSVEVMSGSPDCSQTTSPSQLCLVH